MKGYGALITNAREARGFSADELAKRLGRTRTFVYRIEQEAQEPTMEQVNALAALLPISVEDLLMKMGANLHAPAVASLPKPLVDILLLLDPPGRLAVEAAAHGQLLLQRSRQRTESQ